VLVLALFGEHRANAAAANLLATSARLVETDVDGGAELVIGFTQRPTFTARLTHDNTRLIIDVPNSRVRGAPSTLVDGAGIVSGVMIQAFETGRAPITRVILTFREPASHEVVVAEQQLVVQVTKRSAKRAKPVAANTPNGASQQSAPQTAKPAEVVRVRDVRFSRHGEEERIVVECDAPPRFEQRRSAEGTSRLEIAAAELPALLERALDVRSFGGDVTVVASYRERQRTVIEVEHSVRAQARVMRSGTSLVWSFFPGQVPSTLSGLAADGKQARKTKTVFVEPELVPRAPILDAWTGGVPLQADQAAGFTPAMAAQTRGRYSGRRIDIDLKDADVHNVLRLLADTGRVNIITADNVAGTVTIRMRNVPWDQALDVVLQAKNLGMEQRGNIIRVAPLADLEKEREMAIARAKQELQLAPLETRLIPVSYAQAGDIQERARDLLSGRGSIAVDLRTNVMIVRDVAGNLDQIEELTRSLDTQTPQVLIEARIVEATSRYLREVGVQWGGDASFSSSTGNPTGLAFPNSIGLAGGASDQDTPTAGLSPFQNQVQNPNFAVNLPAAVGTGSGGALGLTFGSVDNNFNLALRLSAAETSGMLRILSSPRVLTLDNREARISQGTLIPFSQVSAQGVQTTFQEAKLQLLVQPHVTADGSVSMRVKINRDEPDFNQTSPRGDPTILKREAQTELLVMDGHTAVIGGIYTRNTGRNVDQVPFFGDIPLLGLLFQKRSASDSRGELVIFLTPRIVNRAEALGR
jgi:type IV pilus assembly protein PilQ